MVNIALSVAHSLLIMVLVLPLVGWIAHEQFSTTQLIAVWVGTSCLHFASFGRAGYLFLNLLPASMKLKDGWMMEQLWFAAHFLLLTAGVVLSYLVVRQIGL
jgi:hypothetical protein